MANDIPSDVLRPDFLGSGKRPLDAIFTPKNVAVVGATESPNAVGRTVLWNLIKTPFGGTVFPVNPKRSSVLGIKTYPSIAEVPAKVDLAVVTTPAESVPKVIADCAASGVKAAVIISAGFKELGAPGIALEAQVLAEARKGRMRILGPNCLGIMNPTTGFNATFARDLARPGNVAFISQSGALCTAILDWSIKEKVGFSAFVSTGTMLDIGWGDLIDYLGDDPKTQSILIYMESIGDARSFLSAAREVALSKPIIVIKPGRTEQAARAATSHTGSLAGSDDVLDAAFKRAGVLRVNTIADLFYMSELLAKQPRPKGNRLTILTNAGGPGVLATDALVTNGGELTALSKPTFDALNAFLPAPWSHNNPVDVLGDATAERYETALKICAQDENADGLLVILTPQAMTESTKTAECLQQYAKLDKPVIASWMGGPDVGAGEDILNRAGIPTFNYPDTAARMFTQMWRYSENLKQLYQTPQVDDDVDPSRPVSAESVRKVLQEARAENRTLLTELESKRVLAAYHIPVVQTVRALTPDEAVLAAQQVGYPVVLKLESKIITHKTDVGGVKLNLTSDDQVRNAFDDIRRRVLTINPHAFDGVTVQEMVNRSGAYELIVGASPDAQFGPVMLFGSGGVLVEVFKDRALALPPLNANLAEQLIDQTKISKALKGVRGQGAVNLRELENILVRFSRLIVEQRWIKEIDINPLLASEREIVALDARIVLHDVADESQLPATAIRPYPIQYAHDWTARDGEVLRIRPIRPEDEPMLVKFHSTLSEDSVRLRYFHPMNLSQRVSHDRLVRVCFNDYDRDLAMVALREVDGEQTLLGVGRLSKTPHHPEAEFAVLISDSYQGKGLGKHLLSNLIDICKAEGVALLKADILTENKEMQGLCRKLGFTIRDDFENECLVAELRFS